LIWTPNIWTVYIYANKSVRVLGYFAKRKGTREQRILGNAALGKLSTVYQYNIGDFNKIRTTVII